MCHSLNDWINGCVAVPDAGLVVWVCAVVVWVCAFLLWRLNK